MGLDEIYAQTAVATGVATYGLIEAGLNLGFSGEPWWTASLAAASAAFAVASVKKGRNC